jgi:integrase
VEEGLIQGVNLSGKSPVYGLGGDAKEETMKPILTLDEVRKFLLGAKIQQHPWLPIWAFAVLTGMRSGELMALEWGDVDEKNGIIRVAKSFNKRIKANKCPKNGTWRNVDINSQLASLIAELKVERRNETHVLPQFPEWKNGQAGNVLRLFLERIGIHKDVVFHTLRACFATHLLSTGVEPLKVMRMGGWSDLKTFQIYLRMSGVDVKGVAEALDVMPAKDVTQNVIPLFS